MPQGLQIAKTEPLPTLSIRAIESLSVREPTAAPVAPLASSTGPRLRAPTLVERLGELGLGALETAKQQPLIQAARAALGLGKAVASVPVRGAIQAGKSILEAGEAGMVVRGGPLGKVETPNRAATLNALSDALEGAAGMSTVLVPSMFAASPARTVATVALSGGAKDAAEKLGALAGLSPEARRFAGNVAATVVAGVGAHRIIRSVHAPVDEAAFNLGRWVGERFRRPGTPAGAVASGTKPLESAVIDVGQPAPPPVAPTLPPAPVEPIASVQTAPPAVVEPPVPPTAESPLVPTERIIDELAAIDPRTEYGYNASQTAIAELQRRGLSTEDIITQVGNVHAAKAQTEAQAVTPPEPAQATPPLTVAKMEPVPAVAEPPLSTPAAPSVAPAQPTRVGPFPTPARPVATAEPASRSTWNDGRWIPQTGETVFQTVRGFGGTAAHVRGEVYQAKNGNLRVRLIEGAALIGGGKLSGTRALDETWTVVGDPEIKRRQQAKEAAEQERQGQRAAEEAAAVQEADARTGEALVAGHVPARVDNLQPGDRIVQHYTNQPMTVTGVSDQGVFAVTDEDKAQGYAGGYLGNPEADGTYKWITKAPVQAQGQLLPPSVVVSPTSTEASPVAPAPAKFPRPVPDYVGDVDGRVEAELDGLLDDYRAGEITDPSQILLAEEDLAWRQRVADLPQRERADVQDFLANLPEWMSELRGLKGKKLAEKQQEHAEIFAYLLGHENSRVAEEALAPLSPAERAYGEEVLSLLPADDPEVARAEARIQRLTIEEAGQQPFAFVSPRLQPTFVVPPLPAVQKEEEPAPTPVPTAAPTPAAPPSEWGPATLDVTDWGTERALHEAAQRFGSNAGVLFWRKGDQWMLDVDKTRRVADVQGMLRAIIAELDGPPDEAPAPVSQAQPGTWTDLPHGSYRTNAAGNLEVKFPKKPDRAVFDALKDNGMRWASKSKVWYLPGGGTQATLILPLVLPHLGETAAPTPSVKPASKPANFRIVDEGEFGDVVIQSRGRDRWDRYVTAGSLEEAQAILSSRGVDVSNVPVVSKPAVPAPAPAPAPTPEKSTSLTPLAVAWEQYDGTGEIQTIADLVERVEELIHEGKAPDTLTAATERYREEEAEDLRYGGRGDMDAATNRFTKAVQREIRREQTPVPVPASAPRPVREAEPESVPFPPRPPAEYIEDVEALREYEKSLSDVVVRWYDAHPSTHLTKEAARHFDDEVAWTDEQIRTLLREGKNRPAASTPAGALRDAAAAITKAAEALEGKSPAVALTTAEQKPMVVPEEETAHATERPDVNGPGRLPERGGGVAKPGRTRGETVLGAVPAEPGPSTPSAGGRERPRHGGSGGVVAHGVQHPAGSSPESAGPTARPEGSAGAGVALSPSGAVHDPGVKPPDYVLTAERIRAIIHRGPLERARDNVAVIRLVKTLATERRYPTTDEQDLLAKYVGWGASEVARYLEAEPPARFSANEKGVWHELRDVTTEEERKSLVGSTPNAHFTFDLYEPIWAALTRFGFKGGRINEPAVGIGHAWGFMPPEVLANSRLTASELDPLTAAIAQALYPSARVQPVGYEKARVATNTQDLEISNVPFGPFGVFDPEYAGKPELTKPIHNYFFVKALEHVRPGGYIVFITSRYTMDGPEHLAFRRYVMDRAHFVGAVRLPNTAFKGTAKTEVVTDVVILQKKDPREKGPGINAELFIAAPLHEELSKDYDYRGQRQNVYRSAWYGEHPELILGEESLEGTMRRGNEYTVTATTEDIKPGLRDALERLLPANAYVPATTTSTEPEAQRVALGDFKPGELRVAEGRVSKVQRNGELVDVTPTKKTKTGEPVVDEMRVNRIAAMVGIRDALRRTIATMKTSEASDADVAAAQGALREAYNSFFPKYGRLNRAANQTLFKADSEAENLLGLETVKPTAKLGMGKKGPILRVTYEVTGLHDIFTKRTIGAERDVTHADSPTDALVASLGVRARVDWDFMSRITGIGAADLQGTLKQEGRVFEQPDGTWALAEEYLSGDVVSKLKDAQIAAEEEAPRFGPNVTALEAIQPATKTSDQVTMSLGAHWIPFKYIKGWVAEELKTTPGKVGIAVDSTDVVVHWTVQFAPELQRALTQHPLSVSYNDNKNVYSFEDLVKDALNLGNPVCDYYTGSGENRVRHVAAEATTAARANIQELRQRWIQWIYAHPDVEKTLTELYNARFNRTVIRRHDGSHLRREGALPGVSLPVDPVTGKPYEWHPHQLNAIWRGLTSGNVLMGHEVGAGKTFAMIALAMEMRRTGRARKPLITVPTHLLGQWREAIHTLYPAAKVLAFDDKDLASEKRQTAMARIAFGDWDMVLVPHSSFKLLRIAETKLIAVLERWIHQLEAAEAAARAQRGERLNVKQLATRRRQLEDKVNTLRDKLNKTKDTGLTWDDLGVDALFVDEAHNFKNLTFFTQMDSLRGISRAASDRALDLYVKANQINEDSGNRNLVLATATPLMNSVVEIYTMQRYLQLQRLEALGLANFDNWYRMFAQAVQATEQQPDGTYKEVLRVKNFYNLRTLHGLFSEVLDYVGWDDMPYLRLPKIKNGRIRVVTTDPHPRYPELQRWFARRLAELKAFPPHVDQVTNEWVGPRRPDPITGALGPFDIVPFVMTDARSAAVDVRLVLGNRAKDFEGSRIQTAAKLIGETYQRETAKRGTILVFLDMGTPKEAGPLPFLRGVTVENETEGGALGTEEEQEEKEGDDLVEANVAGETDAFNLYDALKAALIKNGVKDREIAYIHQARNAAERLALSDAVNEGTVRVLIMSTDKGGTGLNVQTRAAAMYAVDAPRAMRPGDMQQRLGRLLRQGNTYDEVEIVYFVTKGTTDEWLWGLLSAKQQQITSFMRGDLDTIEETDLSTMSIEESQARASNDPRAIELINLRGSIQRLEAQATAAERAMGRARADLASLPRQIEARKRENARIAEWIKTSNKALLGKDFSIEIRGTTYTKGADANKRLIAEAAKLAGAKSEATVELGTLGNLKVVAERDENDVKIRFEGLPWGSGKAWVTDIHVPERWEGTTFGEGRNIISSLLDRYEDPKKELTSGEERVQRLEEDLARAKAVTVTPLPIIAKAREVRDRIEAIEQELRAEGIEKQQTEENARKSRAAEAERRAQDKKSSGEAEDAADVPGMAKAVKGSQGAYEPDHTGPPVAAAQTVQVKGKGRMVVTTVYDDGSFDARPVEKR